MKPEQKVVVIIACALFVGILITSIFYNQTPTGYIVKEGSFEYYLENPDEAMEEYNSNLQYVPNFVKTIFGNERINAVLTLEDGTEKQYGIVTQKGEIIELEQAFLEDPTLELNTNQSVIQGMIAAENQVDYLREALDTKAIDYHAVTVKTKTKTFFAKMFLKIYSWFD